MYNRSNVQFNNQIKETIIAVFKIIIYHARIYKIMIINKVNLEFI